MDMFLKRQAKRALRNSKREELIMPFFQKLVDFFRQGDYNREEFGPA